jgi:hypothetical protein
VWVTAISTLDKLDDDTARKVLVEVMRSTVAKTQAHLSRQQQQRILRLLGEAAQKVHDELGG